MSGQEREALDTFSDSSTADPIEKARRYLKHMAFKGQANPYFFDDGFPREVIADDAAACLAVFESLAARAAQPAAGAECVGCEGRPALANSPCGVCGLPAPAADGLPELPEPDGEIDQYGGRCRTDEQVAAIQRHAFELGRQQAVPRGWKLVPAESIVKILGKLHPERIDVDGQRYSFKHPDASQILDEINAEFRAMLAASPQAPADEGESS